MYSNFYFEILILHMNLKIVNHFLTNSKRTFILKRLGFGDVSFATDIAAFAFKVIQ